MIRVGFIDVFAVREWLGGLNYLRNLLQAVASLDDRRIEPVLFVGTGKDTAIASEFSFLPVIHTRALARGHPLWIVRKVVQRALGSDPVLAWVMKAARIDVLSHSGDLGRGARLPSIAWVPDMQHRYLKHLFSKQDADLRDEQIARALDSCARMIASSESAAADLRAFAPQHAGKIRVLRFASGLLQGQELPGKEALQAKYDLHGPFLHLPNQFWVHKNHAIVVEGLRNLKRAGRKLMVVSTGLKSDPRQPEHFDDLMKRVAGYGLAEMFRPLGVVPYADMLGLMRDAAAVINPSLFEGWSTSVEEAKSMGKMVVLSDIPVHREQAPEGACYFDPHDAADAADAMWSAWTQYDPVKDEVARADAAQALRGRVVEFAQTYQRIVLEATGTLHT